MDLARALQPPTEGIKSATAEDHKRNFMLDRRSDIHSLSASAIFLTVLTRSHVWSISAG